MPTREQHKNLKIFTNEIDASLKNVIKGTKWKKREFILFQQIGNVFFVANFFASSENTMNIRITTKPMALDTLFWEIFGLSENNKRPLSFRGMGWFTCPMLNIFEEDVQFLRKTPSEIASNLLKITDAQIKKYKNKNLEVVFSDQIKQHPRQIRNGEYGISLITCLICEGKLEEARFYALAYENRQLLCHHSMTQSDGKSFNQLAMEWIDKQLAARNSRAQ